jgi:hypothetical protein
MLLNTKSQFSSSGQEISEVDLGAAVTPEITEQPLGDVFFSTNQEPSSSDLQRPSENRFTDDELSEVPRMQSIHNTAGYRDGVAASKEGHVQDGFDEGYTLGAEIGFRVGWIIGVLEGLLVGAHSSTATSPADVSKTLPRLAVSSSQGDQEAAFHVQDTARQLLVEARSELTPQILYSEEYFQPDGVWKYELSAADHVTAESGTTFSTVAAEHPLVFKWNCKVRQLSNSIGADLDVLKDQLQTD